MTLSKFIITYMGMSVGTKECVSLMRQYLVDVLGLPPYALHALGRWGGAKDLFLKFSEEDAKTFIRIPNVWSDLTCIPKPGDIVIFKTSLLPPWLFGWDGHVGVVKSATGTQIIVFNQNYPTGYPCQLKTFTYKDCLGWLRKK